jgi:hypothetical protein
MKYIMDKVYETLYAQNQNGEDLGKKSVVLKKNGATNRNSGEGTGGGFSMG